MGWRETAAQPASNWRKTAALAPNAEPNKLETDPLPAPAPDSLDFMKPDRPIGATALGLAQGGSLGFQDEVGGAADVVSEVGKRMRQGVGIEAKPPIDADPAFNPNSPAITKSFGATQPAGNKPIAPETATERAPTPLVDVYRKGRDALRADNKTAYDTHPRLFTGGEVAGGMSVPVPGGPVAGFGNKVAVGAAKGLGFGMASGAGNSGADLTHGEVGQFTDDVERSGKFGAAAGAAGGVLDYGASKLAAKFGGKADAIKTATDVADAEKIRNSNLGAMRQKKAEIYRLFERAAQDAENPALSAQARATAKAFPTTPYAKQLAEQAASNLMADAPEQLGGLQAAEDKFAGSAEEALAKSDEKFGGNAIVAKGWPRVKHYGAPAIAAALGGAAAGPLGAGGAALVASAMGKGGRAAANFAKDPAVQVQALRGLESGANALGSAMSKGAPVIATEGLKMAARDAGGNTLYDEGVAPTLESAYGGKKKRSSTKVGSK